MRILQKDESFLLYCVIVLLLCVIIVETVLKYNDNDRTRVKVRGGRQAQRTGRQGRRREDATDPWSKPLNPEDDKFSDFEKAILRDDIEEAKQLAKEELKNIEEW